MIHLKARPDRALRGIVRSFGLRETQVGPVARRLIFPARTDQMLEFYLGTAPKVLLSQGEAPRSIPQATLVGSQAMGRVELFLTGNIRTFTISFTPTGFNQLFGIPMHDVAGLGVDAGSVLGPEIDRVRESLGNAANFETMVFIAECFLMPLAHKAATNLDRFLTTFRYQDRGPFNQIPSLDTWSNDSGLSHRQFERRFKTAVGVSPKRYLRVRRLDSAIEMKVARDELTWSQIAAECGYFDQMHLVKEFKELGGEVPTTLIQEVRYRLVFGAS